MKNYIWNNTDQLKKIMYRLNSYFYITYKAVKKGVSVKSLFVSRFPFYFPTSKSPASISIELTDACDLACVYCNNPLMMSSRTFMSNTVFKQLTSRLDEFNKVDRIRVGGGEPTLHPQFKNISEHLARRTKFLSIVTNAQWKREGICEALLNNYDLIELSVDAGGKDVYETSRVGSKYGLLIKNLENLQELKRKLKSKSHINLRLMVRPSKDAGKENEFVFWKKYSDTIMVQYIIKHFESDYDYDVYQSKHTFNDIYPKCTLPFKDLQVRANGNVPLCQVTGSAIDKKKKVIIGNVVDDSLVSLWHGEKMRAVRTAHKRRIFLNMEVCRGCTGV